MSHASASFEPPDCYPIVEVGRDWFGGRQWAQKDDLRPSWNLNIRFDAVNSFDPRVLHIRILDKDLKEDDSVGSCQVRLAHLVSKPGSRTIRLFHEKSKLMADGLLAIMITTERL